MQIRGPDGLIPQYLQSHRSSLASLNLCKSKSNWIVPRGLVEWHEKGTVLHNIESHSSSLRSNA